jgi:hypothetical protein
MKFQNFIYAIIDGSFGRYVEIRLKKQIEKRLKLRETCKFPSGADRLISCTFKFF